MYTAAVKETKEKPIKTDTLLHVSAMSISAAKLTFWLFRTEWAE
jgi:hypothetical protein